MIPRITAMQGRSGRDAGLRRTGMGQTGMVAPGDTPTIASGPAPGWSGWHD